ncbi:IclR family transcriptional regulator [Nitratireductor aquimarinus]|uniref:IclR family transcriptional regulator n=1 Tax=Nitratireductor aquimarinus TaxID=889300 RepID=UPI001A8CEB19|nr:IclR family transcriptional regulator [Nitratireductor aquimarinus]MBN8245728.1 IclR family transcriptional regulator [Nitratireductor aquimarinus]MBY6134109.1 IclR family transcriptional regulator [Nitratireductor aquimarinus]MCA1305200.1 IclR family transcriptional regulator [Nitratireductor aquimarinus]
MRQEQTVPAIDRMMTLLRALEAAPDGLTPGQLTTGAGLARATVYRLIAVMEAHGLVTEMPTGSGKLVLGGRLAQLGRRVRLDNSLVRVAQPLMDRLSAAIGQTVKLAVRDGFEGVVVAVSQASEDHRITARLGQRYPIHIGPSVRLLLTGASDAEIEDFLSRPLKRYASRTIVDTDIMLREIEQMRRTGWAEGDSEGFEGVGAIAAAISAPDPYGVAALSIVYVHQLGAEIVPEWREELRETAAEISRMMG